MAGLAAGLGLVVGAPIAWIMAEPAAAVVASVADQARDLADLLGQRSPGTRTQAELTKHARAAAKTRQQPKAAAHQSATAGPKTAELVDLLSPPLAPVGVVSGERPAPLAPPPTLNAILASAPVITSFTPPSDGGGPVHFPTSEAPRPLAPTSAVPEPGTWAMMLMGFGLIAWRVRRRRSAPAKAVRRAAA
jgi:hypothetical protein